MSPGHALGEWNEKCPAKTIRRSSVVCPADVFAGAQRSRTVKIMANKWKVLTAILAVLIGLAGCSLKPDQKKLMESGKQFMAKRDFGRASLQFRNAIQANPKNSEAHYLMALAQIELGDTILAYRELSRAIDLDPKNMEAQLKMAELLTISPKKEELEEAEEHAKTVLDASPDNPDALDAMAAAELKLGNQDKSQELLERASDKAPDAPYARHWAYVKPVRPALPAVREATGRAGAIDHFVLARLEAEGLAPSPPADRETLIRRVSLDLTRLAADGRRSAGFRYRLAAGSLRRAGRSAARPDRPTASAGPRCGSTWPAMPTRRVTRPTGRAPSGGGAIG